MLIEFIKFLIYSGIIVIISKYVLVTTLRKLAETLNLKPKTVGDIAGYATSMPELLTIGTSSFSGLISASIVNVISSNVINLIQYVSSIFLNKNQKVLKNRAIKIDLILVAITIIIPIILFAFNIEINIGVVPIFIGLCVLFVYLNSNVHKLYLKNEEEKYFTLPDGRKVAEGEWISLDGSTGNVYGERIETVPASVSGNFAKLMGWADQYRQLKVRTNADTPRDALQARKFGAEGIGLCRTEHMFFEEERIFNFRRMITAETVEARKEALEKILPYQRSDFKELFKAMEIYPVTIRFLDPPLHEFLPHTDEEIRPLAESLGMTFDALKARVESLKEFNPMMGHRGCRLAVTYPEIAEMQTRAVIEAAIAVNKEGQNVVPEIMIPLVGDIKELKYVKDVVCKTADAIIEEAGVELPYKVGTMIEIPRAALTADEIAKEAEFFSFGTNDLTQMTYGFSRDDAAKFLNEYYTKNIFESDPFAHIDENGVGQLMQIAINKAKPVRPDIKLGICGEHGGDPRTVEFCHRIGLTYVSCSPYRVPLARLAAAQAAVKEKMGK